MMSVAAGSRDTQDKWVIFNNLSGIFLSMTNCTEYLKDKVYYCKCVLISRRKYGLDKGNILYGFVYSQILTDVARVGGYSAYMTRLLINDLVSCVAWVDVSVFFKFSPIVILYRLATPYPIKCNFKFQNIFSRYYIFW